MTSQRAQQPHLLRVAQTKMLEFAQVVAAMRQDGRRVGWLEWSPGALTDAPTGGRPETAPLPFPEAREVGVLRAVAVEAEQTVVVKPRRGTPVLRDVLREHFRGASLVLVHSPKGLEEAEIPLLEKTPGGWRIVMPDATSSEMTTEALVAALRRPRPFAKERP